MVMQIIEECASENGLAALLQEKPFAGINGSGKHNNWSLGTVDGVNLLNPKQLNAASKNPEIFPVVMAALVSAIDKHGDLMRLSIASPGNDFRLGAMEAPPAVMSTYLGEDMTKYLMDFMETGKVEAYVPQKKKLDFGADAISAIEVPAEDRNRTSPFPYGGARFEFRAAGSAQNVSIINTCLNTIAAEAFQIVADRIEAGETPTAVAQDLLKKHSKVIFNGNGYDPEWPEQAVEKGIWRIDSGVDAIKKLTDAKNTELFEKMGVLTPRECEARKTVLLEHYVGSVEMEAMTMVDMINQHVIPSCKKAELGFVKKLEDSVKTLKKAVGEIHGASDEAEAAALARVLRLDTMIKVREVCDEAEGLCPLALDARVLLRAPLLGHSPRGRPPAVATARSDEARRSLDVVSSSRMMNDKPTPVCIYIESRAAASCRACRDIVTLRAVSIPLPRRHARWLFRGEPRGQKRSPRRLGTSVPFSPLFLRRRLAGAGTSAPPLSLRSTRARRLRTPPAPRRRARPA